MKLFFINWWTYLSLQAYIRHPELGAAKENRDYAYKELRDAMDTISGVAQASGASDAHPYEGAGELASALDELMVMKGLNNFLWTVLNRHYSYIWHRTQASI